MTGRTRITGFRIANLGLVQKSVFFLIGNPRIVPFVAGSRRYGALEALFYDIFSCSLLSNGRKKRRSTVYTC